MIVLQENNNTSRIEVQKGDVTPTLNIGDVMVFGLKPENGVQNYGLKYMKCTLNEPELDGQLSRQALLIALTQEGPRVKAITEKNTIVVWCDDKKTPYKTELKANAPLGGENGETNWKWEKLGKHFNVDITTENGSVVRLLSGGTSGQFEIQVNPKEPIPSNAVEIN